MSPAALRRPIEISRAVDEQSTPGVLPVGASVLRAKTVQHRLLPPEAGGRQLEDRAVSMAAAVGGRAVEVARIVHDNPRIGIGAIGAAGPRAEAVQHGFAPSAGR